LEKQKEWQSGYLEAIDYHNREMARAILGQTLTTDDSARIGSLALGKVHLQVLVMQLAGLRSQLADKVMNEQVIKPVIDINYGGEPYPVFEFAEPALEMFRTGSTQ
jgi:phage gp29-like protein